MLDLGAGDGPEANRLKTLPTEIFAPLQDLRWLSLEGHGLALDELPSALFAHNSLLQVLLLGGNTVNEKRYRGRFEEVPALIQLSGKLVRLDTGEQANRKELFDVRWFLPDVGEPEHDERLPRGLAKSR